jgi:DNA-binding beta-propeller fold protein YncE
MTRTSRSLATAFGVTVGTIAAVGGVLSAGLLPAQGRGATSAALHADPLWPRPLPNHWILGSVTGVAIDKRDHVWLVHRGLATDSIAVGTEAGLAGNPPTAEICCNPAPQVLEFDAAGALVSQWGGPGTGYDWPVSPGAFAIDAAGNLWITAAGPPEPAVNGVGASGPRAAGAGRAAAPPGAGEAGGAAGAGAASRGATGAASAAGAGGGAAAPPRGGGGGRANTPPRPTDAHILEFSPTGQFIRQIGKPGQTDKADPANLNQPVGVAVNDATHELFVADGGDHQRVAVFDASTGAYKRQWAGHGSDFARLSCLALSKDGLVYVCDRKNDRLQVFKTDGTFVKEAKVSETTTGHGSVWGIGFSSDPQQRQLYVADGQDEKVWVLDRTSLAVTSSFGDGGRIPGEFYAVNSVAANSKGDIFTGEGYQGHRLQRFTTSPVSLTVAAPVSPQTGPLVQGPKFEVDPVFPKPLPNHWVMGMTIGVTTDAQDNVWVLQRPPTLAQNEIGLERKESSCCAGAPPVLEFDQAGNLLRSWGGPGQGYEWPESNHGLFIDSKGVVWIGGNGSPDSQVLKFTQDGKFIAQFGHSGQRKSSNDMDEFGRPAKIFVDPAANEAYIADGYLNRRVAVIDADTGAMKRYWGGYGKKPDDAQLPAYDPTGTLVQDFRGPVHCAQLSVDGLVYVCDRQNDRVQVFKKDGTFVKEVIFAPKTKGDGSTWDIAFSRDPQQTYLYLADGKNMRVLILNRQSLEVVSSFGDGGRQPGQFFGVHSITTDSKGNIFTTETYEGRRVQKFVLKGITQVPKDQGVVWPVK